MSDLVVYRISTVKEWAELQSNGSTFGGELDKSTGFIHLSKLDQVHFIFFLSNIWISVQLDLLVNFDARTII
jgi:uncharacterized protein (DUF952 family)